jgi:RNase H.
VDNPNNQRSVETTAPEASTLTITNRSVPELVLYTDASYYQSDEVATTGVVIEDGDGRVLHTAGVELSGVTDSVTAERYALVHGLLETTHYFGKAHVQAYADCNAVIEQVRSSDHHRAGPARQALRDVLAEIHVVRFDHINRASNVHADSVARYTADLIRK